jgi:hypothetical protein
VENLELPVQMNPCLRIFIASLLDESTLRVTHEIRYDGRAGRVDRGVMDAFGGDVFKAKINGGIAR